MAGTPTSRGCDYCRKQKQKCDQLKPQCTRCKRLRLPCTGAGQRRYLFKPQHPQGTTTPRSRSTDSGTPSSGVVSISPPLQGSEATRIAQGLVRGLQVTDPRYGLWVYGVVLEEVPRRLGRNGALDAATDSFSSALSVLHTGQSSDVMHRKYIDALTALRTTLDDTVHARSSNTLCAIYLLIVTQLFLGVNSDPSASHSRGVLQIVQYASSKETRDQFELDLLKILSFQVIFDSLFNRAIQLDDHFYRLVESWDVGKLRVRMPDEDLPLQRDDDFTQPVATLVLRNLARLPPAIHAPHSHVMELNRNYQQARFDLQRTTRRIRTATDSLGDPKSTGGLATLKLLILHQSVHGLLLTIALLLNGLLRALDPGSSILVAESAEMVQDVQDLAAGAAPLRPLGASYMPLCLMVACAVATDPLTQLKLENLLEDWQRDFIAAQFLPGAGWLRGMLREVRATRLASGIASV